MISAPLTVSAAARTVKPSLMMAAIIVSDTIMADDKGGTRRLDQEKLIIIFHFADSHEEGRGEKRRTEGRTAFELENSQLEEAAVVGATTVLEPSRKARNEHKNEISLLQQR